MKRFMTTLAVLSILVLATSAMAQNRYGWTISASSTDPSVNATAPTFGVATYYLWYQCSTTQGMAASEFDVVSTGVNHLATTPVNGYINAGTTTGLLLAIGGCPPGPLVACNLLVLSLPGNMCLAPSSTGNKVTVDCEPVPTLFPIDWIGLDVGLLACGKGMLCPPDAVEETSWGQLKSLYR